MDAIAKSSSRGSVLELDEAQRYTAQETQKIMAPHLDSMKREIQTNWPGMDPELMLLHWLCTRHQLEMPPHISLARRAESQTMCSMPAPQPPVSPPSTSMSPTRPGRILTAAQPCLDDRIKPEPCDKTAMVDLSDSLMRCNDEGCDCQLENSFNSACRDVAQDSPCLSARLRRRREETKKPELKTLRQITNTIEKDVTNLEWQENRFRENTESIATHVATMRMELRGKFVANVPLLSLNILSREEQFRLVGKLRPWNYDAGDTIFSEGEDGDKLFIIEGGTCQIYKNIDQVCTRICKVDKGDFFGELAVLYDMPRSATVVASTSVTLLSLSREDMYSTINEDRIEHMKILARAQVFSSVPMLCKLDTETKVRISGALRVDEWSPGQMILREKSHVSGSSRRLYIIETGKCLQSHKRPGANEAEMQTSIDERRRLSRSAQMKLHSVACQTGDYCGMLEFLYGCPQLRTLKAIDTVTTLSISYDEMMDILKDQAGADSSLQRMIKSVRIHLIRESHPILKGLSDDDMDTLIASAKTQTYEKYETIYRQGEKMQALTMLEQGQCIEYNGHADTLMELDARNGKAEPMGYSEYIKMCTSEVLEKDLVYNTDVECTEYNTPGETFGTSAIVDKKDSPAPFTIVAISPKVHTIHISRASLEALPRFRNILPEI